MQRFDTIVIGLGGVGSAAAMHLARQGKHVCGIEQFSLNHNRGSSHGQSRIIRQAYFEHPDYVPLLKRAYTLWHELETKVNEQLFLRTGLIEIGPPDGIVIPGVLESANRHNLRVDQLSRAECAGRYPQFRVPDDMTAVFERDAGMLFVEQCVRAHLELARKYGAELRENETFIEWQSDGESVTVTTNRDTHRSDSLIITGGAWSVRLLRELQINLRILNKQMHWFDTRSTAYNFDRTPERRGQCSPAFFYEAPSGFFYGFPVVDSRGLKVCKHSGGDPLLNPDQKDRALDEQDVFHINEFVRDYLLELAGENREHETCMYAMSEDEHFIVDLHPQHNNVAFAAGLSGHGFKFTPVLGQILAEMVTHQSRHASAEFLSLGRRGI